MSMANPFVLVGSIEAGKSTLFNALLGKDETARKTQAVTFAPGMGVDTPGEFLSHPRMYHALLQTVADVPTIVYVHDCTDTECRLPPGLLDVYAGKRLIGVITKTDLPGCDIQAARQLLRTHGVDGEIYEVSAFRPETVEPLRRVLLGQDSQANTKESA